MKTILASILLCTRMLHAADPLPQAAPAPALKNAAMTNPPQWQELGFPVKIEGASPNPLIDYSSYRKIASDVEPIRAQHRVAEEQFATMAAEPGTVVLDARSADKYAMRHIQGAVSLPFTDFTADALAKVIPAKDTRVLIYCNNNFTGAPRSLAAKGAPASLNISTYIALATYGYTNIYELAPLLDVKTTKLPFTGTEVQPAK